MECLICKQVRKKWFHINFSWRRGENTIKDDIIEFVGESVREDLNDDQCVCNICLNMLDEIVQSKHQVLTAIKLHGEQKYTPKLGKLWTTFLRKSCDDNTFGDLNPSIVPSTPTLSDTSLMYLRTSKPYNQPMEKIFEMREGLKREYREELNDIDTRSQWSSKTDGRPYSRKDKQAFRSKSTTIKKMKRDLASAQSEQLRTRRAFSTTSEVSLLSLGTDDFDEIQSVTSTKRRRRAKKHEEPKEVLDLKCSHRNCRDIDFQGDLNCYTFHRIEVHYDIPYHSCWICGSEYFTEQHLSVHLKKHYFPPILCGICGIVQKNVMTNQQHIDQHLSQPAFECFICKLSFLSRKDCNSHIFKKHRHRRLFMERKKPPPKPHKIEVQKIYKTEPVRDPVDETSTGTKTYESVAMDAIVIRPSESFKAMSFKEYYLSQKLGVSQRELEPAESQPLLGLGDDMTCKGSGEETFQFERATDTPNGTYDRGSTLSSPTFRRRRCTTSMSGRSTAMSGRSTAMSGRSTVMSGRSTPYSSYERSSIPSDDDVSQLEMSAMCSSSYLATRRDLESRNSVCSEIEGYFPHEATPASEEASPSIAEYAREEQVDSEVEGEVQYLVENKLVSSLSSSFLDDGSLDKS